MPQYTVDDYQHWERDWELIDGLPFSLKPSSTYRHQRLSGLLLMQISNSIDGQKDLCEHFTVIPALDWIVNETTVVRPDIAIVRNERDDFITSPPALIIEILSPSTAFKDRQVKFDIYQEQGVKYYLLVDPDKKTYTIYQLSDPQYKEQNNLTSFTIHNNCSVQIDIASTLAKLETR